MKNLTDRLTEQEVRERLELCSNPQVLDELYTFGQMMLKETLEITKTLDSKAASMAAYGGAAVTLLVSTSGAWLNYGFASILALSAVAGIGAFTAAFFAVRTMALKVFEWLGEKEWLEDKCFSQIDVMKRYRVLSIWGAMDSQKKVQLIKVDLLKTAQRWLSISVFSILLLLLDIVWFRALRDSFWMTVGKMIQPSIHHYFGMTCR